MSFPSDFTELQYGCHRIIAIDSDHTMISTLKSLHIPSRIFPHLFLFTIPSSKINLYKNHYHWIRELNPYQSIAFSFADFLLAYIAAENIFGVVSYDHHLLVDLQQFLRFDAYWPQDVSILPSNSMIFIDTNILIQVQDPRSQYYHLIFQMFVNNPSITFLLSSHILEELIQVQLKIDKKKTLIINSSRSAHIHEFTSTNESLMVEDQYIEDHLANFIEEFRYFERKHRRQKSCLPLDKSFGNRKPNKYRQFLKNTITPRYRYLFGIKNLNKKKGGFL